MTLPSDAPSRLRMAKDPGTPPDQLAKLAADANLHVRLAASGNAATPRDTLDMLRRAGCTADLASPAPPDPTLDARCLRELMELGEWARRLVAAHPAASAEMLRELAHDSVSAVRRAVARHPAADSAALAVLLTDADPATRDAAAQHANAPADLLNLLHAATHHPTTDGHHDTTISPAQLDRLATLGPHGAALAAAHPHASPDTLTALASHPSRAVREALICNPSTPSDVLDQLEADAPSAARLALAQHPHASPTLLARLAVDSDFRVRSAVACHHATTAGVLRALLADGSHAVRIAAAAARNAPRDTLDQLVAAGSSADLLGFAACDPQLAPQVLRDLAQLGAWGRHLAARHPATPGEVLETLACDGDPLIREAITKRQDKPALISQLVRMGSSDDLQGYSTPDPAMDAVALHSLAGLGPWPARLAARHPSADASLLTALADHAQGPVRVAVAQHPRTSCESLIVLAGDALPDVRWALTKRTTLPESVCQLLAEDPLATIRLAIAVRPDTSETIRSRLAMDLDEEVRGAASQPRP